MRLNYHTDHDTWDCVMRTYRQCVRELRVGFFADDTAKIRCTSLIDDCERYFDAGGNPTAISRPLYDALLAMAAHLRQPVKPWDSGPRGFGVDKEEYEAWRAVQAARIEADLALTGWPKVIAEDRALDQAVRDGADLT